MLKAIDRLCILCFETIARYIEGKAVLKVILQDIFNGIMQFARDPFKGSVEHPWCEMRTYSGRCRLPNGRFCNEACMNGTGVGGPCPPGYHPSHVWGYQITGCWCDAYLDLSFVCCDCTPAHNSPYVSTPADCGCMHFIN